MIYSIISEEVTEVENGEGEEEAHEPTCWETYKTNFGRWNRKARRMCRKMAKSQAFYWLIIVLVFLNTMVLATEHYKQPPFLDNFQGTYDHYKYMLKFKVDM